MLLISLEGNTISTKTPQNGVSKEEKLPSTPVSQTPESQRKEIQSVVNKLAVELFTGDALVRGFTRLNRDYLKNLTGTPQDYAEWGETAFTRNQYALALDFFTKYVQTGVGNPDPQILNKKGLCHLNLGQRDQAMEIFNKLIAASAPKGIYYNNRGLVHFLRGHNTQALEDFRAAIRVDPTLADAHYHLALAEVKLDHIPEALNALEQAVKLDWIYLKVAHRGEEFKSLHDNPKYQEIILATKTTPEMHAERSVQFYRAGDFSMANVHITTYLKVHPRDVPALTVKGHCLFNLDYVKEALTYYQKALEMEKSPATHNNVGFALYTLSDYGGALQHFQKALEMNPAQSITLWNLALTEMRLTHHTEALAFLRKAIAINVQYMGRAREHKAFDPLCNDPEFKKLVSL